MLTLQRVVLVCLAFNLIGGASFCAASSGDFKAIDVPIPGVISTVANGINAQGDIVGEYQDSLGSFHGRTSECCSRNGRPLAGSARYREPDQGKGTRHRCRKLY